MFSHMLLALNFMDLQAFNSVSQIYESPRDSTSPAFFTAIPNAHSPDTRGAFSAITSSSNRLSTSAHCLSWLFSPPFPVLD